MKDYLSITQLSRLRGVTSETLRHYDRIDLFKPEYIDSDTGYRYYSLRQVEEFDTIIDLKNMGLSLQEIKGFMERRNLKNTYELLQNKSMDIQKEIEKKQSLLEQIKEKISYIEDVTKNKERIESKEQWCILKKPARKVVISKLLPQNRNEFFYEITKLRKNLNAYYSVFASDLCGSIIGQDNFQNTSCERFEKYPAFPASMCKEEIIDGEIMELPEGEYLCGYASGLLVVDNPVVKEIRTYIKEKGYYIAGNIYETSIIDTSITNVDMELAFKFEIFIKRD